jgi:hypothetical protein
MAKPVTLTVDDDPRVLWADRGESAPAILEGPGHETNFALQLPLAVQPKNGG